MSLSLITLEQAGRTSLPRLLERRAEETPDRRALVTLRGELTFREWHEQASATAAVLADRLGDLEGERVLLWMGNDDARDFVVLLHALVSERAIVVAVDERSTAEETRRLLDETDPKGLLLSTTVAANLGPAGLAALGLDGALAGDVERRIHAVAVADRSVGSGALSFAPCALEPEADRVSRATAQDDAIIFFSSGSTGAPKGAVWKQGDLVQYVERAAHAIYALPRGGRWLDADDVLQSPIPAYTAASVMENPYAAVVAGCVVVYETSRFDAVASEQRMLTLGTTIYNGAPPHFAMMCDLPPGPVPEHLELMISGGSAFTPALYRRMRTRWPHVSLANWYGLMESGCGQTLNCGPDMEAEPGAIGRPVPPTKVRIVDDEFADVAVGVEGELWTQATAQMREYFRNPEQTAKRLHDGWLRTGDRALIDGDGILHVVGRNEERINRGGFKFYPIEIEAVLEADPQVREVAVITVPHETLGQDVVAFVVPADGAEIDPDALRARCKMRVAPNKVPSQIFIKDALPRTAYGKVVRRSLAGEYEQMKAAR